jgi:serine-type D-Ala-D-Ala carboxypeptidase/endopeptidase (penicillin-binding protein 4)
MHSPTVRVFLGLLATAFLVAPAQAQTSSPGATCSAQITNRIDRIVNRTAADWSILVQNQAPQGQRRNIYAYNPSTLLIPASSNKVFTTAAALAKLGPQYQIQTPVTATVNGSDIETLRVIGQGDPSFSTSQLRSLTRQLKDRGVRKVNLLIGDDTVFRGEPFNPYWSDRHRGEGYAAPVNSLLLNENNIYDSSVPNPGNYFVGEFRRLLNTSGIQVVNSTLVKRTPAPMGEVPLAMVTSPPLSRLINETNQYSNNVYAEALLKTLGRLQDPGSLDTTTSGVNAVKTILTDLGVNPNRYTMYDGSGLADRGRSSAEALVQTLQAMAERSDSRLFRQSLAVAGRSGTLSSRMVNTSAQGVVLAKTGTLRGAVSLSGYVEGSRPLVFSMIANSSSSASTLRAAMDEIAVVLSRSGGGC